MKNLLVTIITALAVTFANDVKSQVSVTVNVGVPPLWGPYGYDDARYYYLPDIDVYYDVWSEQYIYFYRGRWIYVYSLPRRFGYYDFYRGYKVVLDYWGPSPYRYCDRHRRDYYHYRNYSGPSQYSYRERGGRPQLDSRTMQRRAEVRDDGTYRGSRNSDRQGGNVNRGGQPRAEGQYERGANEGERGNGGDGTRRDQQSPAENGQGRSSGNRGAGRPAMERSEAPVPDKQQRGNSSGQERRPVQMPREQSESRPQGQGGRPQSSQEGMRRQGQGDSRTQGSGQRQQEYRQQGSGQRQGGNQGGSYRRSENSRPAPANRGNSGGGGGSRRPR